MGIIFLIFFYQLTIIQVGQGEMYKNEAMAGTLTKQMVPAARGEIVDRYGRPFTTNRVGYNVLLDRTFLPRGKENEVINNLIKLMEQLGQGWTDNLPISETAPFVYKQGMETEVARLKKALDIAEYATAEECIYWLATEKYYDIATYTPDPDKPGKQLRVPYDDNTTRKLAGVRYEMVQRAFSLENTYTFATDVGVVSRDTVLEHSYLLPGVDVIESPTREYVDGTIAPHILGYIGPINDTDSIKFDEDKSWYDSKTNPTGYRRDEYLGKSGIEKTYEEVLRGKSGERLVSLDYRGNVESAEITIPPTPGNTVVLTLDRNLQRAAQDALDTTIKRYNNTPDLKYEQGKGTNAGAVVVQHVKTGEILAMASYPTYDGSTFLKDYNRLKDMKPGPLMNRATMGQYRPGSIYKPSVAVAGLTEGSVGLEETINCTHVYTRFADYPATCMYMHGPIDVVRSLQVSCNIYFYETGWRLGIDRMNAYSARLGLGHKTGIEILEGDGQLSSPETQEAGGDIWTNGDVIQSAIGQLDHLFTPVQMASYVATLANSGVRMQSHLVKAIKSYDFKETVSETPVTQADKIDAPTGVFEAVQKGMVAATASGGTSGWQWTGFPLTVASKTGTPEVVSKTDLNAVYICYIPAEDPQIAIAVALENAGSGNVAAPVARLIAEEYFFGGSKNEVVAPMGQALP